MDFGDMDPYEFEAEIEAQAMEALAQEEAILAELENEGFMDNSAPRVNMNKTPGKNNLTDQSKRKLIMNSQSSANSTREKQQKTILEKKILLSQNAQVDNKKDTGLDIVLEQKVASEKKLEEDKARLDAIMKRNFDFNIHRTPPVENDFMPFTATNGDRLYLDYNFDDAWEDENFNNASINLGASYNLKSLNGSYLSKSIDEMKEENERQRRLQILREENGLGNDTFASLKSREESRNHVGNSSKTANMLWVDSYSPESFQQLLSSEKVNRQVLRWLKSWDPVVFKRKKNALSSNRPPGKNFSSNHSSYKNNFGRNQQANNSSIYGKPRGYDNSYGRNGYNNYSWNPENGPRSRVILLCGPPGAGKTTLAHVAAKHAGYKPVEINASDERSGKSLKRRIVDAMEMQSMFGEKKPNCIILDEIDGAAGGKGDSRNAIDMLLKMIKATQKSLNQKSKTASDNNKKRKGKPTHDATISRPIICICNDQYAPVLRPLRGLVDVYVFRGTKSERLVKRLKDICRNEKIHVPAKVLSALVNRTDNDIRSCLNTLQFLSSRRRTVTLHDLESTAVGHKDQKTSLFEVWNAVFSSQKNPTLNEKFSGLNHESRRIIDGIHENYLAQRYTDPNFERTLEALNWMQFGEYARNSDYFEMALVGIRAACKSDLREKTTYPRAYSSMTREKRRRKNILLAFCEFNGTKWKGSRSPYRISTDSLSHFLDILNPPLRKVSVSLMTREEKAQMRALVELMVNLNINYTWSKGDVSTGRAKLMLDPPLSELATFGRKGEGNQSKLGNASRQKNAEKHLGRRPKFSHDQLKTIIHEIESFKLTRQSLIAKAKEQIQANSANDMLSPESKRRLQNDMVSDMEKSMRHVGNASFEHGRSGVENRKRGLMAKEVSIEKRQKIAKEGKHGILFKFTQGFTNAVHRKVFVSEFAT